MPGPVRVANQADAGPLAASLARAFFDDPVMSFLIPAEASRRRRVARRTSRSPSPISISPTAVATPTPIGPAAPCGTHPTTGSCDSARCCGAHPRWSRAFGLHVPRALRVVSTIERQHPRTPHWYLAVLGTDPIHQGKGIGSALLSPILERCDRDGIGAYLESSKQSNIAFYRRHRFEVTGEIVLPGGPPVWPMWRDPRPPEEG